MQNSLDSVLNLPHLGIFTLLMVSSNYIAVSLLKQLNDIDNDCDDKLTLIMGNLSSLKFQTWGIHLPSDLT